MIIHNTHAVDLFVAPEAQLPTVGEPDLQHRVRLFLAGSNLPGLRYVQVEVSGDTVTLGGQVRTFYEKQLAARLSRHVAGVFHVVDQIEVRGYVPRAYQGRNTPGRADGPRRAR